MPRGARSAGPELNIHGLANRVHRVRILGQASRHRWRHCGLELHLAGLPRRRPDPACAVLELHVDGGPARHPSVIHLREQGRHVTPLARRAAARSRETPEPAK